MTIPHYGGHAEEADKPLTPTLFFCKHLYFSHLIFPRPSEVSIRVNYIDRKTGWKRGSKIL